MCVKGFFEAGNIFTGGLFLFFVRFLLAGLYTKTKITGQAFMRVGETVGHRDSDEGENPGFSLTLQIDNTMESCLDFHNC